MVVYLNLRGSSFSSLTPTLLPSLRYVDISFTPISKMDFRACAHLAKLVKDESQQVEVNDDSVIWTLVVRERNLMVNSPCIPAVAQLGTHDTSQDYG